MGNGGEQRRRTGILSVADFSGVVSVQFDHLPREQSNAVGPMYRRVQGGV
jgi:hypothetical protein